MARIDSFLRLAVAQGVSDVHLHAGQPPLVRHDGELVPLLFRPLSDAELTRLIDEILSPEQQARRRRELGLDFVYPLKGLARFRANVFVQARGLGAVFRTIPERVPSLDELAVPSCVRRLTDQANGLILVTGANGAGKSTTLAAMVREINATSQRHIITIEDPIEFVHQPLQSVVTQRQIGEHAESSSAALRAALREAPDVLVVGEMRDLETIQLALSAAETGVLVLGTLHTKSAARAIDRILDMLPEESREQSRGVLSLLLRGVISQRLVRRANGRGRIAAMEVLMQCVAVSNLIRENKLHLVDSHLQTAGNDGSGAQSLELCLTRLVRSGHVLLEDARREANYPAQLDAMVGGPA